MRTTVTYADVCRRLTAVVAGLSLAGGMYAAAPATGVKPEAVVKPEKGNVILSQFIDDPKVGKDPFFPGRRQPPPEVTGTPVVGTTLKLKLGGITVSGTKENRLAIINNRTYSVGEEFEIKLGTQTHKVRVEEIKDRAVIINVDGAHTQELTLPKNF